MAGSLNKVMLIGNLGADPEVKSFQNGGSVCNLSVATSESWKDKQSGERRDKTEWHKVSIFQEGAVNYAKNYLRKGSKVFVEGQIETRKWQDQNGQDKYTTEIVVRPFSGNITGLDGRGEGGGGGQEGDGSRGRSYGGGQSGGDQSGGGSGGGNYGGGGSSSGGSGGGSANYDDLDDDIPF